MREINKEIYRSFLVKKIFFGFLLILFISLVSAGNFEIYNSSDESQPYFFVNGTTGYVGIGTSIPSTLLQILNDRWISAKNAAGTGSVNILKVNSDNQIEFGSTVNIGNFEFSEDSGLVTFADMPVSSTPSAGTSESYVFKVDGENIATVYSEADGSGGVQNKRFGIGTITPEYPLDVRGQVNASGFCISGDCKTSWSAAVSGSGGWNDSGSDVYLATTSDSVGIGTTDPQSKLHVNGAIQLDSYGNVNDFSDSPNRGLLLDGEAEGTGWYGAIRFRTNYNDGALDDAMIIKGSNVGIGTTSPGYPFEVTADETWIATFNTTGSNNQVVKMVAPSGYNTNLYFAEGGTNEAGIRWDGSNDLMLFKVGDTATDALTILDGGNVGIGTTSPGAKLHIKKDDYNGILALDRTDNSNVDQIVYLSPTYTGVGLTAFDINIGASGQQVRIQENGNVGIGTTSPKNELNVIGDGNVTGKLYIGNGAEFTGDVEFNGGWENNGLSIIDGDIFAQTGYFYNISSLEVSTLNVNGSIIPYFDNQFDIGSATKRYNDAFFGGNLAVNGTSNFDEGTLYVDDGDNRVGIGTTDPDYALQVGDDISTVDTSIAIAAGGNNKKSIRFYRNTDTDWELYEDSNEDFIIEGVRTDEDFMIKVNDGGSTLTPFFIDTSNTGNVGIGTTSPGQRLHVVDSSNGNEALKLGTQAAGYAQINYDTTGHYLNLLSYKDGTGYGDVIINNGNIGIGTTSPGAKLVVSDGNSGATAHSYARFIVEDDTHASINLLTPNTRTQYVAFGDPENSFEGGFEYNHATQGLGLKADNSFVLYSTDGNVRIGGGIAAADNTLSVSGGMDITGNVGIGTTSPATKLEIAGDFDASSSPSPTSTTSNKGLLIAKEAAGDYSLNDLYGIDFSTANSVGGTNYNIAAIYAEPTATPYYNAGALHFLTNTGANGETLAKRMTILSDGNVGIGTTSPGAKLDVAGNIDMSGGNRFRMKAAGSYFEGWYDSTPSSAYTFRANSNGMGFGTYNGTAWNYDQMVLLNTGNVGIGTTGPGSLLTVEGGDIQIDNQKSLLGKSTGGTSFNLISYGTASRINTIMVGDESVNQPIMIAENSGYIYLNTDGNVGIGTTSPASALSIGGSGDSTYKTSIINNNYNLLLDTPSSGANSEIYFGVNGDVLMRMGLVGATNNFRIRDEGSGIANFYINGTSGNVGIGTASPSQLLNVEGASASINISATSANPRLYLSGADAVINPDASNDLYFGETGDTGGYKFRGSGDSYFTGNVGIGTTNPNAELHIGSDTRSLLLDYAAGADWSLIGLNTSDGSDDKRLYISSGSGESWSRGAVIELRGNEYTSGADLLLRAGSSSGNLQLFTNGGNISLSGSGGEKVRMLDNGNVGIGTTGPGEKLEIDGGSIVIDDLGHGFLVGGTSSSDTSSWGTPWYGLARANNADLDLDESGSNGPVVLQGFYGIGMQTSSGKLVMTKNGNVGIGTTSPLGKLHVFVSTPTGAASPQLASDSGLIIDDGNAPNIQFRGSNTSAQRIFFGDDNADAAVFQYDHNLNAFDFVGADGAKRVTIQQDGNVGIGTTSPNQLLELQENGATIRIDSPAYSGYEPGIEISDDGAVKSFMKWSGTDYNLHLGTVSNNDLKLYTDNNPRLTVTRDGNVGIGTTSPSGTLHVANSDDGVIIIEDSNGDNQARINFRTASHNWSTGIHGSGGPGYYKLSYNDQVGANDYITVLTTGEVGIGTTAPNYKLEVDGNVNLNNSVYVTTEGLTVSGGDITLSHGTRNHIEFGNNGVTAPTSENGWKLRLYGSGAYSDSDYGFGIDGSTLWSHSSSRHEWWASGTERMSLDDSGNLQMDGDLTVSGGKVTGSNSEYISIGETNDHIQFVTGDGIPLMIDDGGNVGIGTTAPEVSLHVYEPSSSNYIRIEAAGGSDNKNAGVQIVGDPLAASFLQLGDVDDINEGQILYDHPNNYMAFYSNNDEQMRIDNSGNVGIGTTSPSKALEISDGTDSITMDPDASTPTINTTNSQNLSITSSGGSVIIRLGA